jgi:anti-sigma factor RsiW
MSDCPNAEIRDQLPDLVNDRLTVSARAAVTAHVAGCVDCRNEVELLRGLQGMLIARTPRIDIAYVVNALPTPPSRATAPAVARRPMWADWRIAAAVALLAVGGSSVAVMSRDSSTPNDVVAVASQPVSATSRVDSAQGPDSMRVATPAVQTVASAEGAKAGLGMSGHLDDLDDKQLQALLDEIDSMQAVPITDPEPVSIKVETKSSGSPEGA